jgi:N-dimethylarginine dimethylaminohydrolase
MTGCNEFGRLTRVLLHSPRSAYGDPDRIASEWRALNFTAPPDLGRALEEFAAFAEIIAEAGTEIVYLPEGRGLTLDALYVHDASIPTPRGSVLCRMGKAIRRHEPMAHERVLQSLRLPVLGAIDPPGSLEGGDVVWFDDQTVAVGHGYRTNDHGILQFRELLGPEIEVIVVPLPHHRGPGDVFHLMSIISPVDRDLAVVYSPLMPVPFREWLRERGLRLVEVPESEFDSMGANVLALAPRCAVMLEGNPVTRSRLEAAGADVRTYTGVEISVKGGGGPTCLTRPLTRAQA